MKKVPEREAAKANGERFYTTGKPCQNGHLSKRYTSTGICAACAVKNTLKHQAKAPEHPERIAARARGDRHYAQGKPCKHGHEDKRFVANGHCVQCSLIRVAKWNESHPGHMAAGARRRRAIDPTGHRAEVKRWREKNPEKTKVAFTAWRNANREHWRAYHAVYSQNRRALKAKNGGFYTIEDVAELQIKQNGKCAACLKKKKLEVDHIKPVIRGGSNDPSNLQLLCRQCNASKGAKDVIEWAQQHGRLF